MGSVRRAIDDSEATYTLGFYLAQDEMDSKFHDIKVKVDRKGVEVRARKGFLAYKDEPTGTLPQAKRNLIVKEAINSPLDATGITMAFRFDRADQVKPGSLQVTAFIDPTPLLFEQRDGKYTAAVEIVIVQLAVDGRLLDTLAQSVNMAFTPERYQQILNRAIEVKKIVTPLPGVAFLKLIVLDHGSGQLGSVRGQPGWILKQPPQVPPVKP